MPLTVFCAKEDEERNVEKVWEFNGKNLTLSYVKSPYYEIDLERCLTGSEVMDWIFQIRWKTWVTPDVMFSFLEEFENAFRKTFNTNAQAMCSGGADFIADWKNGKIVERKNHI